MSARRPTWIAVLLAVAAWSGLGFAQLEVDSAQGPLTLPEEVESAFAAWQEVLPDDPLDEPAARIAFAPGLLGPSTASLTLRWSDGRTEVLLSPERYRRPPVLLHELGLLLGLRAAGEGVMDPVLSGTEPTAPTEDDAAALRDARTFPPADIDRDGRVDFYDLAALGAAFGSVGVNLDADLNGDGVVDAADLALLREDYAFSDPVRPDPEPAAPDEDEPAAQEEPADPGAEPVPPDEDEEQPEPDPEDPS